MSEQKPQNIEAEMSILGAILIESEALLKIPFIGVSDFYNQHHAHIYGAMLRIRERSEPIDFVTVSEELRKTGTLEAIGGVPYLSELANDTPTAANITYYARIVAETAQTRKLLSICNAATEKISSGQGLNEVVDELFDRILRLKDGNRAVSEKPSELTAVNAVDLLRMDLPKRELILSPWLPTQGLAMVHAYRGVGKTFVGLGIGVAIASAGIFLRWTAPVSKGVLYIDGEMPVKNMQDRLAAAIASIGKPLEAPLNFITSDLQEKGMPDLSTREGQSQIEPFLEGISVVIIDNISTLFGGRENQSEDWAPAQAWALELRRRGISAIFMHHDGKGGLQRGTSKKEDVLDTVLQLKRPADYHADEGARFEVHFEKARGFYGDEAKAFEARLMTNSVGEQTWALRDLEESLTEKVARLLNDGIPQNEIHEMIGVTKGTVSKHKKKAQESGLLKVQKR